MAIYYVNDHLIQEELVKEGSWPKNNDEVYKRISIRTAAGAMRRNEDGSCSEFTRILCAHNCSIVPGAKTRIMNSASEDAPLNVKVNVRTSTDTKYDTDVFVVAIPYEGMVVPFGDNQTDCLSIYKSMILKSDKMSIAHEDHQYKRCLYLICVPNHNALDATTDWYSQQCDLQVTTARSDRNYNGKDADKSKWTLTHHTVKFGLNGMYEYTTDVETIPYDQLDETTLRGSVCYTVEPRVYSNSNSFNNTKR